MNHLLTVGFIVSLCFYLGIAGKDIRLHYSLDGTDTSVPLAETAIHLICGTLVTVILVLLLFSDLFHIASEIRGFWLSVAPICLTVAGLVDEFAYHRPRCRKDPKENWYHAVLHFSMGSTLVLAYVRWY